MAGSDRPEQLAMFETRGPGGGPVPKTKEGRMELTKRKMVYAEAKDCIAKINANMTNIRQLVLDLYEMDGWSALGYASWRECVTAEFKNSQQYLYYQLEAAKTERNISTTVEIGSIPERHLRPLTKLRDNPEQQREAWQKAVDTAPEGKVTAAHVYRIVKDMTATGEEKPKEEVRDLPSHAMNFATIAISQLERIRVDDPRRDEALARVEKWIAANRRREGK
jgi:hypothetical protein